MSWPFGGRRRTYVGTQVTRMIEDSVLSELAQTGIMKAIIRSNDIGPSIVDEILAGFGTKTERAFTYAQSGAYAHGLPNHTFISDTVGLNEAKALFEASSGGPINLVYHHFAVLNPVHVGFQKAIDTYGYNQSSNVLETLSATVGFTCYLNNIVGYVNEQVDEITDGTEEGDEFVEPDADKMLTWDRNIAKRFMPWVNPRLDDPQWVFHPTDPNTVKLYYSYASDTPNPGTQAETDINAWEAAKAVALAAVIAAEDAAVGDTILTIQAAQTRREYELGIALDMPVTNIEDFVTHAEIDLGIAGLDVNKGYFQSKYDYDLSGNRRTKYFTYEYGTGTYPTLDAVASNAEPDNEFLPFIFFREAGADLTDIANEGSEPYDSSKAICRLLDLDYSDFGENINTNPDVDKIEQAIMLWAVPVNSQLDEGIKYLYKFFEWLHLNDRSTTVQYGGDQHPNQSTGAYSASSTILASQSTNKSVTLQDSNFRMQLNYGGLAKNSISGRINVKVYLDAAKTIQGTRLAEIGEHNVDVETEDVTYEVQRLRVVNNQDTLVTETITKTVEIYVFREQLTLETYSEIRVAGLNMVYQMDDGDVTINSSEDSGRLLIPLNHSIVNAHFNAIDKDRLYSQAFHTVFNTKVTKKIPWYATSFFQGLLIVVAIVVTIITLGQAAPAVAEAYALYAASYGVVLGAIMTALELIVIEYVKTQALQLVVEEIGGQAGIIIATIAFLAGSYAQFNNIDFAPNLLQFATGLSKAGTQQINTETTKYLLESAEFQELAEQRLSELDAVNAQFEVSSVIDPLEFVGREPLVIFGETPDEFYNRTVHAGNIGTGSYEYISNYVDNSLQLPTFEQTIRGQF